MNLKFDLQFFGSSGGTDTQQIRKRDPEPQELTNLRMGLYNAVCPGLQSFNSDSWIQAQMITNNALQQQRNLLSQVPSSLNKSNNILNQMQAVLSSGNLPTGLTNRLNAGVTKDLQSSMGEMLNSLGNRGVLNSSITSQGVSRLGQQAADAFNKNYLSAYNSVLSGYGTALQGSQANTSSLLSALGAIGNMPKQAYEGVYAGLTPAYNLWKDWQNSYDNREDYDTIVTEHSSTTYCITGDTPVTLANGESIPVSELRYDDEILVWDFDKGCVTHAPLMGFFKRDGSVHDVTRVEFEDGSSVGVIFEHLFFDMTLGKFVAVNADSTDFIGHEFARVNDKGEVVPVKVTRIYNDGQVTETYGPQCVGYLNYLTNGVISGNDGQLALCNAFEFDTENMRFDAEKKKHDLETYPPLDYIGVYDDIMSEDFYYRNHFDELFAVVIGKGLVSPEDLHAYFAKFTDYFLI